MNPLPRRLTVLASLAVLLAFGLATAVPGHAIYATLNDDFLACDEEDELELGSDKTAFFERLIAAYPELTITTEQLQALLDDGWGLGDLVICVVISADCGKSFEDVLALAESGMGWGEVAKECGIEARNLGQSVSAAMGEKGLLWKGHEQDIEFSVQNRQGHGDACQHDPQHQGQQPNL
jgi:hypothetical protein